MHMVLLWFTVHVVMAVTTSRAQVPNAAGYAAVVLMPEDFRHSLAAVGGFVDPADAVSFKWGLTCKCHGQAVRQRRFCCRGAVQRAFRVTLEQLKTPSRTRASNATRAGPGLEPIVVHDTGVVHSAAPLAELSLPNLLPSDTVFTARLFIWGPRPHASPSSAPHTATLQFRTVHTMRWPYTLWCIDSPLHVSAHFCTYTWGRFPWSYPIRMHCPGVFYHAQITKMLRIA